MPLQSTVTQTRFNTAIKCLTGAAETLKVVADSFNTPFLEAIFNTTQSLLTAVQTVRRNRDDCTQLMEQIYSLLYAIISLHIQSEIGLDLSPGRLNDLAKLTETIHKIHTFVEAQQEKSRIKQFFHQSEMSILFQECNTGLQQALDTFKAKGVHNVQLLKDIEEMQKYAEERHQEVLQFIEACSDDTSDRALSMNQVFFSSHNSSNSISMLPSEPQIFHGRESELATIIKLLKQDTPRIAILGAGGMGKTCLARVALHHPEVIGRYGQCRFFVACDSASTQIELAATIGAHLGLKPGKDLTKPVVQYFAKSPACLLILDNLETLWEPSNTRGSVEEFLSLLTDVTHLAMIPLTQDAARQTLIDIADDDYNIAEIDQVLELTDNMPLAINLIAHLVDLEGCSSVLSRWDEEQTAVISKGVDRRSNLDLSIGLSLSSPRLTSLPHAQDLLGLLSMLPDGLSDTELVQSKLPIEDILTCKATLLRTSLAYSDGQKQLKTLVPIREYMQRFHPPESLLVRPLLIYFQDLLEIHQRYRTALTSSGIAVQIASNFSNIQNILQYDLQHRDPETETVYCIIYLNVFSMLTGRGFVALMNQIPRVLSQRNDPRLEVYYITELLSSWTSHSTDNAKVLLDKALKNVSQFNDPDVTSTSSGNTKRQSQAFAGLALTAVENNDYSTGRRHALEAQRMANISAHVWEEAEALRIQAYCWEELGYYQHALLLLNRASHQLGLCGENLGQGILDYKAEVHKLKSEYAEAHIIQSQRLHSLTIEQEPYHYAMALLNVADTFVSIGAPKDDVERNIETAKSVFNTLNYAIGLTMCDTILADLALREGNMVAANTLFHQCLNSPFGQRSDIRLYCLERLADGSRWNPVDWRPSWATVLLVHCLKPNQRRGIYQALQFLGNVFQAQRDLDTATNLLTIALEGFTVMDLHRRRAECFVRLGDISKDNGDLVKAVELWKTAKPLFERSSGTTQATQVDERLAGIPQDVF
ncbi:hypothetical protein FB451DRAFT_1165804 [Mycena latifolia]|nr:hypothetical protein FB451DRAFT_1165804 [Mycena latifolia]